MTRKRLENSLDFRLNEAICGRHRGIGVKKGHGQGSEKSRPREKEGDKRGGELLAVQAQAATGTTAKPSLLALRWRFLTAR